MVEDVYILVILNFLIIYRIVVVELFKNYVGFFFLISYIRGVFKNVDVWYIDLNIIIDCI